MFGWLTERRRNRLLESEFPAAWTELLESNVGAYHLLDESEQARLRDLVQVFVAEKNWEGCGGLELDDEIRITVAGTGCLMLLGRDHDLFAEVESILIYPSAVVATEGKRSTFDTSARVVEDRTVLGLAVKGGAVVLAWDSALQGARDARDGRNVVIHELAHKIDFLDGDADGTPELETHAQMQAWAAAFAPAFLAHKERAAKGKKSLLDDYAITNEAEYFAVASEVFFEKPKALAKQLPAVYRSLADFFKLDLAAREAAEESAAAKGSSKHKDAAKRTKAAKPAAKAKADDAGAAKHKPSDSKSTTKGKQSTAHAKQAATPTTVPAEAPRFRKTAAMAAVSLPLETPSPTAKPPTKTATPSASKPASAPAASKPTSSAPSASKPTSSASKPASASPTSKSASASSTSKPASTAPSSAPAPRRKSTAMAAVAPPADDEPSPAPPRFRKTAAMSVVSLSDDE
jgi:MtfA peptidase